MLARVCKICSLRSPGLFGMAAYGVAVGKGYPNGAQFNTNRRDPGGDFRASAAQARQPVQMAHAGVDPRRCTDRFRDPDRFHAEPTGRVQIVQAVVYHDAAAGNQAVGMEQAHETLRLRFGPEAGTLDREHIVERRAHAERLQYGIGIARRRVRKYDLAARQAPQHRAQFAAADHQPVEVGKPMRLFKKMIRIDAMMAHKADQRRTVTLPVTDTQQVGVLLAHVEQRGNVGGHRAVDLRKDVHARIVQGVIEIEDPDPRPAATVRVHRAGNPVR